MLLIISSSVFSCVTTLKSNSSPNFTDVQLIWYIMEQAVVSLRLVRAGTKFFNASFDNTALKMNRVFPEPVHPIFRISNGFSSLLILQYSLLFLNASYSSGYKIRTANSIETFWYFRIPSG